MDDYQAQAREIMRRLQQAAAPVPVPPPPRRTSATGTRGGARVPEEEWNAPSVPVAPVRSTAPVEPDGRREMVAGILADLNRWSGAYREVHGHAPGRGNDETEREAIANRLWSEDLARRRGSGPSQQEWEQHWAGYKSGADQSWGRYLAGADEMLRGAAAEIEARTAPAPVPVETGRYGEGVPPPPGRTRTRDPLQDEDFDLPLQDRPARRGTAARRGAPEESEARRYSLRGPGGRATPQTEDEELSGWQMPFAGDARMTQAFGANPERYTQFGRPGGVPMANIGLDYAVAKGTPIRPVAPGVVERVHSDPTGWGNYIRVRHEDGSVTQYSHLDRVNVREGQTVGASARLGTSGATGYTWSTNGGAFPHLDFTYYPEGFDPSKPFYGAADPSERFRAPAAAPERAATGSASRASTAAPSTPFSNEIETAAEKHGVDPNLLRAIIQAESSFNPDAYHRGTYATGLMQVLPREAASLGPNFSWASSRPTRAQLSDPAFNIDYGARYLAGLIDYFDGDVEKGVQAYHDGAGNVERGRITENGAIYVPRVMGFYEQFQNAAPAPVAPTTSRATPTPAQPAAPAGAVYRDPRSRTGFTPPPTTRREPLDDEEAAALRERYAVPTPPAKGATSGRGRVREAPDAFAAAPAPIRAAATGARIFGDALAREQDRVEQSGTAGNIAVNLVRGAGNVAAGIPMGLATGVAGIANTLDQALVDRGVRTAAQGRDVRPEDTPLYQLGVVARDAMTPRRTAEEDRRSTLERNIGTVARGIGSFVPFVAAGVLTGGVGSAALGATSMGGLSYDEAIRAGAGPAAAYRNFAGNAALGALEAIPAMRAVARAGIGRVAGRVAAGAVSEAAQLAATKAAQRATAAAARRAAQGTLRRAAGTAGGVVRGGLRGGLEEGTQEIAQQAGSNWLAASRYGGGYDPDRELEEGLVESAVAGGGAGLLVNLVGAMFGLRLGRGPGVPDADPTGTPRTTDAPPTQNVQEAIRAATAPDGTVNVGGGMPPVIVNPTDQQLQEAANARPNPPPFNTASISNPRQVAPPPAAVPPVLVAIQEDGAITKTDGTPLPKGVTPEAALGSPNIIPIPATPEASRAIVEQTVAAINGLLEQQRATYEPADALWGNIRVNEEVRARLEARPGQEGRALAAIPFKRRAWYKREVLGGQGVVPKYEQWTPEVRQQYNQHTAQRVTELGGTPAGATTPPSFTMKGNPVTPLREGADAVRFILNKLAAAKYANPEAMIREVAKFDKMVYDASNGTYRAVFAVAGDGSQIGATLQRMGEMRPIVAITDGQQVMNAAPIEEAAQPAAPRTRVVRPQPAPVAATPEVAPVAEAPAPVEQVGPGPRATDGTYRNGAITLKVSHYTNRNGEFVSLTFYPTTPKRIGAEILQNSGRGIEWNRANEYEGARPNEFWVTRSTPQSEMVAMGAIDAIEPQQSAAPVEQQVDAVAEQPALVEASVEPEARTVLYRPRGPNGEMDVGWMEDDQRVHYLTSKKGEYRTAPASGWQALPDDLAEDWLAGNDATYLTEQIAAATSEPTVEAAPEEATAPEPAAIAAEPAVGVVSLPVAEIAIDPARFQYKEIGIDSTTGVGADLQQVRVWDEKRAGLITVWRDPADGLTYVINGHHRVDLARRLGVESINAIYSDAATDTEARMDAAMDNIADGKGSVFDAAKVLRSQTIPDLEARGIALTGGMVRQGLALAQLNNRFFHLAVNNALSIQRAVAIGEAGLSVDEQNTLYSLLEKKGKGDWNVLSTEALRLLAIQTKGLTTSGGGDQLGLFGDEEIGGRNLLFEALEIGAYVRGRLKAEASDLGLVGRSRTAATVEGKGATTIDRDAVNKAGDAASRNLGIFDDLYRTTSGVLHDAIKQQAEVLANGGPANTTKEAAFQQVRGIIEEVADGRRRADGSPRSQQAESRGAVREAPGDTGPVDAPAEPAAEPIEAERPAEPEAEAEVAAEPFADLVGREWEAPDGPRRVAAVVQVGGEPRLVITKGVQVEDGVIPAGSELLPPAELDRLIEREVAQAASKRAARDSAAEEKAKQEAARAQREEPLQRGVNDFLETFSPMRRARVKETLTGLVRADGETMPRYRLIEREVFEQGATVQEKDGKRVLMDNRGRWRENTTKTALDYADFLVARQKANPDAPTSFLADERGEVDLSRLAAALPTIPKGKLAKLGAALKAGSITAAAITAGGLGYVLTSDIGEEILRAEWDDEDEEWVFSGYLADGIRDSLADVPEAMRENAFLATLSAFAQPSNWTQQVIGLSSLANPDLLEWRLPDEAMRTAEEREAVAALRRLVADHESLSEQERTALWHTSRIAYSGPVAMYNAYLELSKMESPTSAEVSAVLESHENPWATVAGTIALDPLGAVSIGTVVRGLRTPGGVGIKAYREWRQAQRIMGMARTGPTSRVWDWMARKADVLRLPEARAVREARTLTMQLEAAIADAKDIPDLVKRALGFQLPNGGSLLDPAPVAEATTRTIQDAMRGATSINEVARRAVAGNFVGRNRSAAALARRMKASGVNSVSGAVDAVADMARTPIVDKAARQATAQALKLEEAITLAAPATLSDAKSFVTTFYYDRAVARAHTAAGQSPRAIRAVQSWNRVQKAILGNTLLRLNPSFNIGNGSFNVVQQAVDGLSAWGSASEMRARMERTIGLIPNVAEEGFNIIGEAKGGKFDVELLASLQNFTGAYEHWFRVAWGQELGAAIKRAGITGTDYDDAMRALGGIWHEDEAAAALADLVRANPGMSAIPDLASIVRRAKAGGLAAADEARGITLLHYWDKTYFDVILEAFYPFHYWQTRSMANWTARVADNPTIGNIIGRVRDAVREGINSDLEDSDFKKDHIPVSAEWLDKLLPGDFLTGGGATDKYYVDLLSTFMPARQIWGLVPGAEGYSPPVDEELEDRPVNQVMEFLQIYPAGLTPLVHVVAGLGDRVFDWGLDRQRFEASIPLSFARPIRGFTAANREGIRQRTGIDVGPSGVDLNAPYRRALGWNDRPEYEDKRVRESLREMLLEGRISEQEFKNIMRTQTGPLWDEAVAKATRFYGDRGAISWLTRMSFRGTINPEVQRLRDEYYALLEKYPPTEDGEDSPEVAAWKKANPLNYSGVLTSFTNKEAQAEAGISMLWDVSKSTRKQWKADLQEAMQGDDPTAAKEAATLLEAIALFENPLKRDTLTREQKLLLGEHAARFLDDEDEPERKRIETEVDAEAAERFPGWRDLQNAYYKIDEDDKEARKAYLEANPTLTEAWEWRREQQAERGGDIFPPEEDYMSPEAQREREVSAGTIEYATSLGLDVKGLTAYEAQQQITGVETAAARVAGTTLQTIRRIEQKREDGRELTERERTIWNAYNAAKYDQDAPRPSDNEPVNADTIAFARKLGVNVRGMTGAEAQAEFEKHAREAARAVGLSAAQMERLLAKSKAGAQLTNVEREQVNQYYDLYYAGNDPDDNKPATSGQMAFARKIGINPTGMTRGEIEEAIDETIAAAQEYAGLTGMERARIQDKPASQRTPAEREKWRRYNAALYGD